VILDSSAVVAALLGEPTGERIGRTIGAANVCGIGAPTLVETAMVLTGRVGDVGRLLLARFMQQRNLDILSFSVAHWRVAQDAFGRFGKGRHPAALNFGDCLTYAIAYVAGEPLLCTGNDFRRTDLQLVDY
jgi:ribonuclease VapC